MAEARKPGLDAANFTGLVLGCIKTNFCKKISARKLSSRSTQCTLLHNSAILPSAQSLEPEVCRSSSVMSHVNGEIGNDSVNENVTVASLAFIDCLSYFRMHTALILVDIFL